jgi:hypothetical protein
MTEYEKLLILLEKLDIQTLKGFAQKVKNL